MVFLSFTPRNQHFIIKTRNLKPVLKMKKVSKTHIPVVNLKQYKFTIKAVFFEDLKAPY